MQLTTATPAQIDEQLARIGAEIARNDSLVGMAQKVLGRNYVTPGQKAQAEKTIASCKAQVIALEAEQAPYAAEFTARGGWTRYYLVEGGHLHYDVTWGRCSRIPSTRHYWMTELSGLTAEEAIELAGDRVCTVCFPQAPVAAQNRPSQLLTADEKAQAQARIEREEKKAAKAKKDAEKGILDPATGGELKLVEGLFPETIKTERAASIKVVDLLWYERFYGADAERQGNIEKLLGALAAKHNIDLDAERAAAEKRLAARIKREG